MTPLGEGAASAASFGRFGAFGLACASSTPFMRFFDSPLTVDEPGTTSGGAGATRRASDAPRDPTSGPYAGCTSSAFALDLMTRFGADD